MFAMLHVTYCITITIVLHADRNIAYSHAHPIRQLLHQRSYTQHGIFTPKHKLSLLEMTISLNTQPTIRRHTNCCPGRLLASRKQNIPLINICFGFFCVHKNYYFTKINTSFNFRKSRKVFNRISLPNRDTLKFIFFESYQNNTL